MNAGLAKPIPPYLVYSRKGVIDAAQTLVAARCARTADIG
jgi:hypothetical protein